MTRERLTALFLVVGVVMFVYGAAGFYGGIHPGELNMTGRAAHYPREAKALMAAGAGLVTLGLVIRRP